MIYFKGAFLKSHNPKAQSADLFLKFGEVFGGDGELGFAAGVAEVFEGFVLKDHRCRGGIAAVVKGGFAEALDCGGIALNVL